MAREEQRGKILMELMLFMSAGVQIHSNLTIWRLPRVVTTVEWKLVYPVINNTTSGIRNFPLYR